MKITSTTSRTTASHLLFCLLAASQIAMAQDAPPVDTQAMLSALKVLEEKQELSEKQMAAKIIQELTAAGASNATAIAFYQDAIREMSFKGQPHEQTLFQDWKKKEADNLKSNEMQTAIRMHLNYLVLTLQVAKGAKIPEIMPGLMNYINQATAAHNLIGSQEMMKKPVSDSVFVRWYGIGNMFGALKNWETSPGNIDGIYQKTILPQMRKEKNSRILEYWDARIQRETNDSRDAKRVFNAERFDAVRKPTLLWSRAKDLGIIGQQNRAISDMFGIIKNYPDHPNKSEWITQLTGYLNNPASFSAGSSDE